MPLTTVVILLAGFGLILLVILELMREVVILRGEVSALGTALGKPVTPSTGQVVDLDSTWSLPDDWFVMSLVSSECPACGDLAEAAAELESSSPGVARRLVFVDRNPSPQGTDDIVRSSEPPKDGIAQRITAPDLFSTLGVTATPTMVLLARRDGAWIVADAAVGADIEWLRSRLRGDTIRPMSSTLS